MGEQGAKSLRGGKMEDVIFAGTAGRPPLGRAEVVLTIDNSDGALPIDYAEVTISRIMFRNGGSEYADQRRRRAACSTSRSCCPTPASAARCTSSSARASSTPCCRPTPEERRGFIEEAAGVLKHRKRKEKALRKLDAMQANLTRVAGPHRRAAPPAQAARPAGRGRPPGRRRSRPTCATARLRLLADDLRRSSATTLEAEVADETALRERRADVEDAADPARGEREAALEDDRHGRRPPAAAGPGDLVPPVVAARAAARRRLPWPPSGSATSRRSRPTTAPGATPRSWSARPRASAPRRPSSSPTVDRGPRHALAAAVTARARRRARRSPPRSCASPPRVRARCRPARGAGPARRPGRRAAPQPGRGPRGRDRPARRRRSTAPASAAEQAQREFTALETQVAGLDEGEVDLDAEHEQAAQRARRGRASGSTALRDEERDRRARARRRWPRARGARARPRAARTAPARCSPPATGSSGLLGSVAALVTVGPATRPRSPRRSARPPTPWPSRPSTPPSARCDLLQGRRRRARRPAGRRRVATPATQPTGAAAGRCPAARWTS